METPTPETPEYYGKSHWFEEEGEFSRDSSVEAEAREQQKKDILNSFWYQAADEVKHLTEEDVLEIAEELYLLPGVVRVRLAEMGRYSAEKKTLTLPASKETAQIMQALQNGELTLPELAARTKIPPSRVKGIIARNPRRFGVCNMGGGSPNRFMLKKGAM